MARGSGTQNVKRTNSPLKEKVSARVVRGMLISVPFLWVLSVVSLFTGVAGYMRAQPVDVVSSVGDVSDVQNWASDYVLVWLGGTGPRAGQSTSPNQQSLDARSSVPFSFKLAQTPASVSQVRPYGTPKRMGDAGTYLWSLTFEATVTFPGEQQPRRNFYAVDVVESNSTYQVVALPRQVVPETVPFKATTQYTERATEGSAMFTSAQNFASAYLTPSANGNLGSTVTGKFTGTPITGSAYSSAKVLDVVWVGVSKNVDVNHAKPGTRVNALVTVQATVSSATYQVMQLPLEMSVMENGQWAVDGFTEFVDFSTLTSQDAAGGTSQTATKS